MRGKWKRYLYLLTIVFGSIIYFSLAWCWNSENWNGSFSTSIYWFDLNYNWKTKFERVALKNDDINSIIDLFQEVWDWTEFKDSLLIAEKYSQWLWVNAFLEENLDTLRSQWLIPENIQKKQITLNKYWENLNAVLVEYDIDEWFIEEIPKLYFSQFFMPNDNNIVMMSFITENENSRLSASNMFKNIK